MGRPLRAGPVKERSSRRLGKRRFLAFSVLDVLLRLGVLALAELDE
jgi:hypothetical protein